MTITNRLSLASTAVFLVNCLGPGTLNEHRCASDGPTLIAGKCLQCHSVAVTGSARGGAPVGVDFDTAADVQRQATAIRADAVDLSGITMPPPGALAACDRTTLGGYLDQLVAGPCLPSCTGKVCGDDGCGGSCGAACTSPLVCSPAGTCVTGACTPNCQGAACGDDGCGGSCGTCPLGTTCTAQRTCACVPNCTGRVCGPDGCGGSCPPGCSGGLVCSTRAGTCGATCTPDCTGRVCGDDGCGGACPPGCTGGQGCNASGQCVCVPNCSGKVCGGDGCGGSCGSCPSSVQVCTTGQCAWPTKTFGTDVWPLFQAASCAGGSGGGSCHSGSHPAASLDLSTDPVAYGALVNQPSTQCASVLLVKPGDIAGSYLVNKLTGSGMCSGSLMPKGGTAFTSTQVDTVRAWIASGAAQ